MDISRRRFFAGSLLATAFARPVTSAFEQAAPAPPVLPSAEDLPFLSVTQAAALLRARRLSPVALTEAVLDRVGRLDSRVQAFITVTRDDAMRALEAARAG